MSVTTILELIFKIGSAAGLITGVITLLQYKIANIPGSNLSLSYDIIDETHRKFIQINVAIENINPRNLVIKQANIYISKGIIKDDSVEFDFLWNHKSKCKECTLYFATEDNRFGNSTQIKLPQCPNTSIIKELSFFTNGLSFICPKEHAIESLLFTLPEEGFYKITFVVQHYKQWLLTKIHSRMRCNCKSIIIHYTSENGGKP